MAPLTTLELPPSAVVELPRQTEAPCREWAVTACKNLETAMANRNDAIRAWNRQGASLGEIADAVGLSKTAIANIVNATPGPTAELIAPEDDRNHPEYGFNRFWERYPRRNGKRLHRASALAVWGRLPYADKRAAYEGAGHFAKACEDGLQIACDAFRWLRDREWEEWQTPAVPDSHGEPQRLQGTDRAKPAAEAYLNGRAARK
jgi:hypothetical protein